MKHVLFFFFLNLALTCFSQPNNFELKSTGVLKEKFKTRTMDTRVIGNANGFTYFLCFPYTALLYDNIIGVNSDFYIQKCDNTPRVISKEKINLSYKGKDCLLEGVFFNGDKLSLFTSFQNQKNKKHYLFVQNMNKETLLQDDSLLLVGEIDYADYSKYYQTYFNFAFSEDKSKMLVYYSLVNTENEIVRYGMYVYTSQMKLLWKNENVPLQGDPGLFSYSKFAVDNEGTVFILGKTYKNYDDLKGKRKFTNAFIAGEKFFTYTPNYNYQIFTCSKDKTEHSTLNIPDKFITHMTFATEKSGNLLCAGLYSEPGTISASGAFAFHFDSKTSKISKLNTSEFSEAIRKNALSDRELKNFRECMNNEKEWDPYTYLFSDIQTRENGKKYLVAEQFLKGERMQGNGKKTYYYTSFNYNNLIVFNLNNDNSIERIDKIEKNQYVLVNNENCSYFSFDKGEQLYFVFMDILRKNTFTKNYEFGDTYLVQLTPLGKQEKTVLQNTATDPERRILPGSAWKLGPGEAIFSSISTMGATYEYQVVKVTTE